MSAPKVGDIITGYRCGPAQVIRVHPFGTVDVVALRDGLTYRITGLAWIRA